jgi:hypothetical protein
MPDPENGDKHSPLSFRSHTYSATALQVANAAVLTVASSDSAAASLPAAARIKPPVVPAAGSHNRWSAADNQATC